MFIGKRPVRSIRGNGEFFCPQCYQRRACRFQIVAQYATLMMVRMFRVGEPEVSVVCTTCHAVFSDAVLDYNPDAEDRQFAAEVLRINVLIAMVDGCLEPVEIATIQQLYEELTGDVLSRDAIENEVRQAYEDQLDAAEVVRRVGRTLGGEGARIVAQQAYLVATAKGEISEQRQAQLAQFPAGLGLTMAGFQQLIDQTAPRRPPTMTTPTMTAPTMTAPKNAAPDDEERES